MFRFAKDGCVRWPVTVPQVQADGSIAEQTIIVTYLRLTRAEREQRNTDITAYLQQFRSLLEPSHDDERMALVKARTQLDDSLLRDRVRGWEGIIDQHDKPLPFSGDVLDAFLDDDLLRGALLQGLVDASTGAKSKNSLPGLAGLPVPAQA